MRVGRLTIIVALVLTSLTAISVAGEPSVAQKANLPDATSAVLKKYGRLPLRFEEAGESRYFASGQGLSIAITSQELSFQTPGLDHAVSMRLMRSNEHAEISGMDRLESQSNYFIGNDPAQWRTNVANFEKVRVRNAYPGVDLIYYGNMERLEYDFVVSPGADPGKIRLRLGGIQSASINGMGDLVIKANHGQELRFAHPKIYQMRGSVRQPVSGGFELGRNNEVGFKIADYDHSQPLVIDPLLAYSTLLGGISDHGLAIAVDAQGYAYVAGFRAASSTFENTFGLNLSSGGVVGFVIKLTRDGSSIVYASYLGAKVRAIALDSTGSAYVAGVSGSCTLPLVKPFSSTCSDGFAAKLSPDGAKLIYSTYVPSFSSNGVAGIAVDPTGHAYVTGISVNFPVTAGAFQTVTNGTINTFVAKFSTDGASLVYGTYLAGTYGSNSSAITVDASGNAYVTGSTTSPDFPVTLNAFQRTVSSVPCTRAPCYTGFVTEVAPDGSSLVYSTFLGGSASTYLTAIALNSAGEAIVGGEATGTGYPLQNALQSTFKGDQSDAVLTKLSADGSSLIFSTYLGGTAPEEIWGVAVDSSGNVNVTGWTYSTDFPVAGAIQGSNGNPLCATKQDQGCYDAFVSTVTADGSSLLFSTYLGGMRNDYGNAIAVDPNDGIYITGEGETGYPTTANAYSIQVGSTTAFISKIANSALTGATLTPSPNPLVITVDTSGNNAPATLDVASTPTGVAWTGASNQTWLTLGSTSGTTPSSVTVTANPASLNRNTSYGTVAITGNAINSPKVVPVKVQFADFQVSGPYIPPTNGNLNPLPTQTVTAGATATYPLTVTPVNNFTGPLTMTCTGLPAAASCSTTPAQVNVSSATAVAVTLNISTTARSTAMWMPSSSERTLAALLISMLPFGIVITAGRGGKPRKVLLMMTAGSLLLIASACGGGSKPAPAPTPKLTGTPAGSYTVTVSFASGVVKHSSNVILNVN